MDNTYYGIYCKTKEESAKMIDYLEKKSIRWFSGKELRDREIRGDVCFGREHDDFTWRHPDSCLVYGDMQTMHLAGYTVVRFFDDERVVDLMLGNIAMRDIYADAPTLGEILGLEGML